MGAPVAMQPAYPSIQSKILASNLPSVVFRFDSKSLSFKPLAMFNLKYALFS